MKQIFISENYIKNTRQIFVIDINKKHEANIFH